MVRKTVVLVALYFGSSGLIISGLLPLPWMWLFCFVMDIGRAGIGFSVTHDALHGGNAIHHIYTSIRGYDEDLEVSPLLRLSPHTPFKPIHRFQHLFAFLGYSMATVFWGVRQEVQALPAARLPERRTAVVGDARYLAGQVDLEPHHAYEYHGQSAVRDLDVCRAHG